MKQFYSLPEVCEQLNLPYHRIYHACLTQIVEPMRAGRSRLFTQADVLILRQHFAALPEYVNRKPVREAE
jgi:hypothetical protein